MKTNSNVINLSFCCMNCVTMNYDQNHVIINGPYTSIFGMVELFAGAVVTFVNHF